MFKMCVRSNALFSVILCLTIIYEAYDNTVRALNAHPESAVLLPVDPVKRKDDVLNLTCRAPANFSKLYVDINFKIFHNGIFINEDYSPQSGELGRRSVLLKKVLDENGYGNYSCTIQAQEGPKPRPNYTASTYVKILTDTETMAHQKNPLVQVGTGVSIQCLDKPHEGLVVNWEGGSSQSNTWDFTLDSLGDVSTRRCRIANKTALGANDNITDQAVASGSALVISRDFIGVETKSTEVLGGSCNVSLTVKHSDVKQWHNLSVEWTSKGNALLGVKNSTGSMLISTILVNRTMEPISVKISFRGNVIEPYIDIRVCPYTLIQTRNTTTEGLMSKDSKKSE
ncbi:uncharacterized protein LOC128233525 isoform X2 [Mya arenaria]|uniref:uncharacterized protein LOC128233525 isoform X2 n=1 Tax=Mya arenaria TaxID=6604 RepID=UPI0022E23046|nr:uncharacterized protein LOC128233525 isoform X2 [Mya arenaria]